MGYVFGKRILIAAVLLLCSVSLCAAEQRAKRLERHARLDANPVGYSDVRRDMEISFMDWLETMLTQVPAQAVAEPPPADIYKATTEEITPSSPEVSLTSLQNTVAATDSRTLAQPQVTCVSAGPIASGFQKPVDIPALYTSPTLEGEGVWTAEDLPSRTDGEPLVYKTVYRPSLDFPNSTVYMAVFDMRRLKPKFFVGQTEPGVYNISYKPEGEDLSKIVAITNAMWMQQHSRGAGAIYRGQVVYPMAPGMATLVIYEDDSVDILEWSDDIPIHAVKDARQLRHLIVKDGAVVEQVCKNGKIQEAEIGLGGFLVDNQGRSTMGNKFWYLANRTAFGVRSDGNLVFAMGHHVGTRDLAKALALAGCQRALHGDANIHNIVCNFYYRDQQNRITKRDKLSPEQLQYTVKRYDQGYAKDFFAFYEK